MPAARRWIRLDAEWDSSDWIVRLHGLAQLAWVRLLCHVKRNGMLGRSKALTSAAAGRTWRIPAKHVAAMIEGAVADGALIIGGGEWVLTKWAEYQEVDRTAAERMRRHRDVKSRLGPLRRNDSPLRRNNRNVTAITRNGAQNDENRTSNPPSGKDLTRYGVTHAGGRAEVQDLELQDLTAPPLPPKPKARAKKVETDLPDDWAPNARHREMALERSADLEHEVEQFRDHAEANARRLKSWDAGFRTWLRNARPTQPHRNGGAADPARRATVKPPSRRLTGAEPDPLWR